jgi:hypothetical protein
LSGDGWRAPPNRQRAVSSFLSRTLATGAFRADEGACDLSQIQVVSGTTTSTPRETWLAGLVYGRELGDFIALARDDAHSPLCGGCTRLVTRCFHIAQAVGQIAPPAGVILKDLEPCPCEPFLAIYARAEFYARAFDGGCDHRELLAIGMALGLGAERIAFCSTCTPLAAIARARMFAPTVALQARGQA